MLDIQKMLTLSTAHIRQETAEILSGQDDPANNVGLSVYEKIADGESVGFFVMLWDVDGSEAVSGDAPEDLKQCVRFAAENGCTVLCLDRDGPVMKNLPAYKWPDGEELSPDFGPGGTGTEPEGEANHGQAGDEPNGKDGD